MKKFLIALILLLGMSLALSPLTVQADSLELDVRTQLVHNPKNDPDGNRVPSRPIFITINVNGVTIQSSDKSEATSYVIYDEDGMLIASYADDKEFAAAIFSMSGTIQIRIEFDDYALQGWLTL